MGEALGLLIRLGVAHDVLEEHAERERKPLGAGDGRDVDDGSANASCV
jgi:hypothetical protein